MSTESPPDKPQSKKTKTRGNFFLIDLPTFAKVCSLDDADAAAAYLILAAGTGADNRTSTWSREAINQRTALNWRKAAACIAKLEQHGLVRKIRSGARPRFDLPPIETRPAIQKHVAALAERIMQGEQPTTPTEKAAATIGRDHGWLRCDDDGTWSFVAERPMVKAYLPNSLVGDETGKATGESTIVDRIRKSRDPMALRLLVDLYALQDLAEHCGVDRYYVFQEYKRESVKATGQFQVWKFSDKSTHVRIQSGPLSHHRSKGGKANDMFARMAILEDAGAIEWAYHLAEEGDREDNKPSTASLIYPVAIERHGKVVLGELETVIGNYAFRAALALAKKPFDELSDIAKDWERVAPSEFLLPAERLAKKASLVGIPRLRCRAKTTNAARWRKGLMEDAESIVQMFRGIINEHAPELLVEADRHLADFNDASTWSSTSLQRDINDPSQSSKHEGSVLRTGGLRPSPSSDEEIGDGTPDDIFATIFKPARERF